MAFAITIGSNSSVIDAVMRNLLNIDAERAELYEDIGLALTTSVQERFIGGFDVDGNPWKISWRASMQGGQTMRDTGRLMNSYTYNVLSNGVEVGTNVFYAPYLHFGATILPKTGQYITFAVGGQYRRVRQVVNPPRTQLGINSQDEEMILNIVGSFIDEHILRGT